MARPAKDSRPLSIRMDAEIMEKLNRYCDAAGQTKTTAIERAVVKLIEDYEETQKRLKKMQ